MLIITRRIGEKFMIGDDIEVMIADVKGQQVRLAISADESIPIYREEIYRRIQQGIPAEPAAEPALQENTNEVSGNATNKKPRIIHKRSRLNSRY